jgi:hypothetical protein
MIVGGGVLVGENEADDSKNLSSAIDRVSYKGRERAKKAMKKTEDDFESGVKQLPHYNSS